jgi:hypothetical protein
MELKPLNDDCPAYEEKEFDDLCDFCSRFADQVFNLTCVDLATYMEFKRKGCTPDRDTAFYDALPEGVATPSIWLNGQLVYGGVVTGVLALVACGGALAGSETSAGIVSCAWAFLGLLTTIGCFYGLNQSIIPPCMSYVTAADHELCSCHEPFAVGGDGCTDTTLYSFLSVLPLIVWGVTLPCAIFACTMTKGM